MSLAAIFLSHVPDDRREAFAAVTDLEALLARIVEAGEDAWREIRVDAAGIAAFLGRCLPAEAATQLALLRAEELYLVCAYGLGVPGAARALDDHYMSKVEAALGRIGTPSATIADIQQELRRRLVEMRFARPDRRGYSGRGELVAWLCVAAVREAGRRREREKRERHLADSEAAHLVSPEDDPETAYLRGTYRQEFKAAFREALASLTGRERNVLRYHLLDGLSIDRIGDIYGVHRATADRWIRRAREELRRRTREIFSERVSLSGDDFGRVFAFLVAHQISVHADWPASGPE